MTAGGTRVGPTPPPESPEKQLARQRRDAVVGARAQLELAAVALSQAILKLRDTGVYSPALDSAMGTSANLDKALKLTIELQRNMPK